MLERAKGCLEHNGRRLFRLRPDGVKHQRLNYAFWSHGATDIETPAWWTDLLSRTTQEEEEKSLCIGETTREYLQAGFNGGFFLDFLYPDKTRRLMRKLVRRDAALTTAHGHGNRQPSSARTFVSHSAQEIDMEASNQAQHLSAETLELLGSAGRIEKHITSSTQETRADSTQTLSDAATKRLKSKEEQLQKLFQRAKLYRTTLEKYEMTISAIDSPDADSASESVMQEATSMAKKLDHTVAALVSVSESLVLDKLDEAGSPAAWSPNDWTAFIRIHLRRGSILSSHFLRGFDWALNNGKSTPLLSTIFREMRRRDIGSSPQSYRSMHDLRLRYNHWRQTAESQLQKAAKPFWHMALNLKQDAQTDVDELIELSMRVSQHMKTKKKPRSDSTAMADTALDLAEVIVRHVGFRQTEAQITSRFFKQSIEVLQKAPASYDAMAQLLSTVLFQNFRGHKGMQANLFAVQIVDALKTHGGYRGEKDTGAPDLERKLFFNLTRLDLSAEAEKLMRNLRSRRMDRVQDYERLRHQLAKTGNHVALHEAQKNMAISEGRLRARDPERLERWRVPALQVYKDRMEAYRRKGQLKMMLDVFEELQNDPEAEPDYFVYCQMISGHARLNDTAGADQVMQQMIAAGIKPGVEAYAPILQAFARVGDVSTVQALTQSMEQNDIQINDWIVTAHVHAHLQVGELKSAEALIFKALTFKMENRTKMWNYVLLAWALKGNHRKVNFLMHNMKVNRIPYDSFTFAARIQMWVVLGRPDMAWQCLKTAMPQLGLRPLPFHYALVIRGHAHDQSRYPRETDGRRLRRKREAVQKVYRHMLDLGLQPDWNIKVAMAEASLQHFQIASPRQANRYLTKLLAEIDHNDIVAGPMLMSKNVGDQYEVFSTGLFDFMFRLSRQKSHLGRFESVWKLYVDFIQRTGSKPFTPPLRIIHRLMMLFRKQQDWTEVRKCWESISVKADGLAMSANGDLRGARRSLLAGPLHGYMLCLREQAVPVQDIKLLVQDVLKRGYTLDNRCWNLYIRILCTGGLENQLLALETAEEQLIHQVMKYPKILGGPHRPGMRLGIMRRGLQHEKASYAQEQEEHYPFRFKTSLGTGLPAGYLDPKRSTIMASRQGDFDDDKVTWASVKGSRRDLAVDLQSIDKSDTQRKLDSRFAAEALEAWQRRARTIDKSKSKPSSSTGLTAVTAMIEEGSLLRRPEYSTLVYLAGVYLSLRRRLAFDARGTDLIDEIHTKCEKTVAMILALPRTNDKIQRDWVQSEAA